MQDHPENGFTDNLDFLCTFFSSLGVAVVSKLRVVDERSEFRLSISCQILLGFIDHKVRDIHYKLGGRMMKNGLQRCLSILIILFSVTIISYGQTEKIIGKGHIRAIQFSPDGRWLGIGTTAILELYDARTYQFSHSIEMNVGVLEFRPDGREMLVADWNLAHRLDTATGQVIETLTGSEHRISDLAYSPDGKQIALIDVRGVVRLWGEHQEASTFRHAHSRSGKYTLLFSPDGEQLIVGALDIEIWDIATVELVNEYLTYFGVTSLALHPDETQLVAGTKEGQIEFWSLLTGDPIGLIDGNDVTIEGDRGRVAVDSLAFSPNGQALIVGFDDAVIAVWDTVNQGWTRAWITKTRPDEEFKGSGGDHGWQQPLPTLSHDGETVVAVADRSANVGRWEVGTGKLTGRFEGYGHPLELGFSDDGKYFFTGWGVVRVWDTATTEIIAEMQYDNGTNAAAHSPDGRYVAISHRDRRITVWDVDAATVKHVLHGAFWNNSVAFSPDSRLIAAVTYSFLIRVWDVETGELIAELQERDDSGNLLFSFSSVGFSPDGKWLATSGGVRGRFGADIRTIAVWETQGFTLQYVVEGLAATYGFNSSVEFSPDSRWIVGYTGRPDYRIKFWNIETQKVDFELPAGEVRTAGFSPDGRWFTTSIRSPDGGTYAPGVQIWDTQTQRLVAEFSRPYQEVIFSPDGMTIAVGYDNGRIHLLPIATVLPYLAQDIPVAVEPKGLQLSLFGTIKRDALLPNYPNPFNPETWIPYQLAAAASVKIHIYNLMGQRVRTLDIGQQPAGGYLSRNRAAYWDGRNALGERVATGIYFYQLETNNFTATRRMVIVK